MLSRDGRHWMMVCLLLACGCAPIMERRSPLAKPVMSPDSVVLEIYSARFPFRDAKYNETLWEHIDEQPFAAELRRTMAEYGFRAGLVQGQLPAELVELMQGAADARNGPPKPQPASPSLEETVVDFEEDSPVRRRVLQLRSGKRGEILASGVYDSLPLLENDKGQLRGQPYPRGQGLLSIKCYPQPDGRVKVDLLPELHYGEPRINYVGEQGIIRLETGRSKKVFEHLALQATVSPGEMLVITSLPERTGSLGHYFFTEQTKGALEQKLLLIRVAQTQHNDLFGADLIVTEDE